VTRLVLAVTLVRQAAVVEIHPADVVQVGGPSSGAGLAPGEPPHSPGDP
jgi:hypothetical protein